MCQKEFNIAYIISDDSDYIMSFISIQSLLNTNTSYKINLYLLVSSYVGKDKQKQLETFQDFSNCGTIQFININPCKYMANNQSIPMAHMFELSNLLPCEKILFLSCQTLINGEIAELYNTDLSNNSCAAAELIETSMLEDYKYNYNKENKQLFRSFVLLINSNIWKQKKYDEQIKLLNHCEYTALAPSDFLFNEVVNDCKQIPLKYSYNEIYYEHVNKLIFQSKSSQIEYKKFLNHIENPIIIVMANAFPYESLQKNSYKSLWWEYAEKTPIYDDIKQFREVNQYKLKATAASNSFNYTWLLSRMWPYIKPYWFRILIGFAISVPLGLLDGVTALALKPYMDYVVGGKALEFTLLGHNLSLTSLTMAIIIPVGIIAFAAIQGVLRYVNEYISAWTSMKITNGVKLDLFHRLVNMHPQFFDDNPSGIVISRYVGDPAAASAGIVDQIKTITTNAFGALGLIAVMLYSSWQLAFIGVIVLCMAFLPVTLLRKRMRMASNKNMVIGGNMTTNMNETYNGNKVMYAYGLQKDREQLYDEQIKESFDVNISLTKRTAWMSPMMYMIASVGIAIVLGVGTYLINNGKMTAGSFASFVTSLLLLYKPVKSLGGTLAGIQNVFVAMGRVFELFDLEPQIKDCENPKTFTSLNEKITFEDVCFEYVPNKPVLKHINLTIPKNETLAIVGNSGGGKSTLVNLINRFYEVKSGAVKYDGVDIREFSLESLRGSISMVFQDNFLYSGTIKENILMGKPNATTEELEHAIEYAHLNEMIEKLPEGLETLIGERGLTLSGGQRQRVAIARAMLRNAPIVILDEATSALDNESEAIVQKAMDNLMQNRTVFIIAHRLSTIKNADRIAVINEGELVELGRHEDLMEIENGQYKHLYEMQFRQQEEKFNEQELISANE